MRLLFIISEIYSWRFFARIFEKRSYYERWIIFPEEIRRDKSRPSSIRPYRIRIIGLLLLRCSRTRISVYQRKTLPFFRILRSAKGTNTTRTARPEEERRGAGEKLLSRQDVTEMPEQRLQNYGTYLNIAQPRRGKFIGGEAAPFERRRHSRNF